MVATSCSSLPVGAQQSLSVILKDSHQTQGLSSQLCPLRPLSQGSVLTHQGCSCCVRQN